MRMMMQPIGTNSTSTTAMKDGDSRPEGSGFGVICLSVCLSHWDKQKTSVINRYSETTCDGRQEKKRRGQDSDSASSQRAQGTRLTAVTPVQHWTCRWSIVATLGQGLSSVVRLIDTLCQSISCLCASVALRRCHVSEIGPKNCS